MMRFVLGLCEGVRAGSGVAETFFAGIPEGIGDDRDDFLARGDAEPAGEHAADGGVEPDRLRTLVGGDEGEDLADRVVAEQHVGRERRGRGAHRWQRSCAAKELFRLSGEHAGMRVSCGCAVHMKI